MQHISSIIINMLLTVTLVSVHTAYAGPNRATAPLWQMVNKNEYKQIIIKQSSSTDLIDSSIIIGGKALQEQIITDYKVTTDTEIITYQKTSNTYEQINTQVNTYQTNTTFYYSDNTTQTGSKTKQTELVLPTITHIEHLEEIIARQSLVDNSDLGTPTSNTLTLAEYETRSDVYLGNHFEELKTIIHAVDPDYPEIIISNGRLASAANYLDQINAPQAWARGWTGNGSNIAIFDTGIDYNHPELKDKIVASACFTAMCDNNYETVMDLNTSSHGTHVAGLAAASFDGAGITGVAPDANLIIAKIVYDNGVPQFNAIDQAFTFAKQYNSHVINISAGSRYDFMFTTEEIETGLHKVTDARVLNGTPIALSGYNGFLLDDTISQYSDLINSDMVLVVAAGNSSNPYPDFPAHYAVAIDDSNELLMGGRVLVVGNYDPVVKDLHYTSSQANTVCYNYNEQNDNCDNPHRISDFFIVAPGVSVPSTVTGGGYDFLTGTSMAAPVVSGAVAIIKQMWPHMSGENIVKLLLQTADKSAFSEYQLEKHGQGLLDLDAATLPQGTLTIPTNSNSTNTSNTLGSISLADGLINNLDSIMVVDSFNRDFYLSGDALLPSTDLRQFQPLEQDSNYQTISPYTSLNQSETVTIGNFGTSFNITNQTTSWAYYGMPFTIGLLLQENAFLANQADSDILRVNHANTLYLATSTNKQINKHLSWQLDLAAGITTIKADQDSWLQSTTPLWSNTGSVQLKWVKNKHSLTGLIHYPLKISHGDLHFNQPIAIDLAGNLVFEPRIHSYSSKQRERNIGLIYEYKPNHGWQLKISAERRLNYLNQNGQSQSAFKMELGNSY